MPLRVLVPSQTYDLTTVEAAKAELGLTGSAEDAALAAMIRQASDAIAAHTRQVWGRETVEQTEWLSRRRDCLVLDRPLAPSIASITAYGQALAPAEWVLDGSLLYRLRDGARVDWQPGTVVITYDAGHVLLGDLPHEVERACLLTVAAWWHARGRDPMLRSESDAAIGSVSYIATAEMGALPPQAVALLAPWRAWLAP